MAIRLGASIPSSRQLVLNFLLCTLLPLPNYAQTSSPPADDRWREAGLPYIQSYSASEYGGDQQNWDIVQDRRGVMYFANQNCLLEYDGVTWRQIYTGDRLSVRSVAIDSSGRLWMGAALEIGYFLPDAVGNLQYTSLLSYIPAHLREVAEYWRVAVTSQGVYFQSRDILLRWLEKSNTMKICLSETGFSDFFVFEDTLYIRKSGIGLMKMTGDSLRLIPGGERFADLEVSAVLPYFNSEQTAGAAFGDSFAPVPGNAHKAIRRQWLAVSATRGLFLYDGVAFQPFTTTADTMLLRANVLCGAVLADGSYALGTRNYGLLIIDRQGNLRRILDMTAGLPGSSVYHSYVDSKG